MNNKLQRALETYYKATEKFKTTSLIDPKILEEIAIIGKREYQRKKSYAFDLAEMSAIEKLPLNKSDVKDYNSFVDSLYTTAQLLFKQNKENIKISQIFKVAGCNSVPVLVEFQASETLDSGTAIYQKFLSKREILRNLSGQELDWTL